MLARQVRTLAGIIAALALLIAGAGSAFAAAESPNAAVTALVSAHTSSGASGGCDTVSGKLDGCPITDRLRARLANPVPGVDTSNLVSRSQQPPQRIDVAQVKLPADATSATVPTVWIAGTFEYTIDFKVVKQDGGWLVDDSTCPNDPSTSVLNAQVGPCPIISHVETRAPGMPATGAKDGVEGAFPLLLLAILTIGLGAIVLRSAKYRA